MDLHDDYRAALAIKYTPGIGPRTWKKLAAAYDSLTDAARDAASWTRRGLVREASAQAFRRREWRELAGLEYEQARRHQLAFTLLGHAGYPARLAEIPDPPILFYYRGDLTLASSPGVAIVGTRNTSKYGLDMAWRFGTDLSAAGLGIISGLAKGIDRQAHLAGLTEVGRSVAVLGTGLARIYPQLNRDVAERLAAEGLILSELPPEAPPEARNFPMRNRIISGLSLGVLVAEAPLNSGGLITARYALEQGREVFAIPGPLNLTSYEGCHQLINDGACLATCAADVLRQLADGLRAELNIAPGPRRPVRMPPETGTDTAALRLPLEETSDDSPAERDPEPELNATEARLLAMISADRTHIDVLGRAAGLTSAEVGRTLISLEINGLVKQWPGMYYSLP